MNKYIKDNHITDMEIERFNAMLMDADELIAFAEHTADCHECAQKLAISAQKTEIHVPKGFAPEVRIRIVGSSQREFRNYCLRVCAAVCASLAILFTSVPTAQTSKSMPVPRLEFLDKVTQSISDFSNNIINWEVKFNDKEK